MVLALNMMDEVRVNGGTIHDQRAGAVPLGIPVIPISAAKNEGIDELIDHCLHVARYGEVPARMDFCDSNGLRRGSPLHSCSDPSDRGPCSSGEHLPVRFAATKLIEGDTSDFRSTAPGSERSGRAGAYASHRWRRRCGLDRMAALADMRFQFISSHVCGRPLYTPGKAGSV